LVWHYNLSSSFDAVFS